MSAITNATVTRYREARDAVDRLKAELDDAKAELEAAHTNLLDEFERAGVQNVKIDSRTYYLHRSLRARVLPDQRDRFMDALVESEAAWLAKPTVNAQTLTSYVREHEDHLPEFFKDCVALHEEFSVRMRGQ